MSTWLDIKDSHRLKGIYDTRLKIIKSIREFFWSQDFLETDTPIATRYPGQEPYLNPMRTQIHNPSGAAFDFFLHTSPELAMKKLLAAGYEKIFQICHCFRDEEEFGGRHNPEFTMIEWYRAPGEWRKIADDTENLFKYLGEKLGTEKIIYKDFKINISGEWERKSMKEIWKIFINVNLDDYLEIEKIKSLVKERGFAVCENDAYEDLFYKIFLNEIEQKLGLEKPIFIYDYPAQMCSLSRLCDNDKRYAERFELYFGGLELANAFGELTDAECQLSHLNEDKKLRKKIGKQSYPVDQDFINALKSGIPTGKNYNKKAAGIALGVDRVVLLFSRAKDINETIFQSAKDQTEFDE